MIIKLERVISCTSEDPSYPASNLLQQRSNSSWRCAKSGELLASVIFQLGQPSCITGMDIGNYRSCIVVVTASTSAEPDNWIPIINHQFLTHDEAANGKFKDQVQLFTRKELNADNVKIKFDRVKVTCMQSANLREQFGLSFIVLRTEVVVELGVDVFTRFKLKNKETTVEDLKEKYMKLFPNRRSSYKDDLAERIKEAGASKFARRQEVGREVATKTQPVRLPTEAETRKKTTSDVAEAPRTLERKKDVGSTDDKLKTKNSTPVARTPFGDAITPDPSKTGAKKENEGRGTKKRSLYCEDSSEKQTTVTDDKSQCSLCAEEPRDRLCRICKLLPPRNSDDGVSKPPDKRAKILAKPTKEFSRLFDDVKFALSGYQNPRRDEIRRKALEMGGRYVADPNTSDNRCTHLVCAFRNTPKSQQLRGRTKIVSHKFIVDCFDKRTRFPWRRFALDKKEKSEPESEDEIEAGTSSASSPTPYEQDTDSDSNY